MTGSDAAWLKEGERFDDLQRNQLKIIQSEKGFRFGMDAVLLSGFVRVQRNENAMDLCSGNGIIPLLLSAKTEGKRFTGLELLAESADMAARSVAYNGLWNRISIVCGDVRDAAAQFGGSSFDVVTCNPPYMKGGHGLANADDAVTIARHEVKLTLEELVRAAAFLVRPKGRVYLVHRPFRLTELIVRMHEADIEVKRLRMVHPYADRKPNMVLVEGVRGGKPYLTVEPPLVVYEQPGIYTKEILTTYGY